MHDAGQSEGLDKEQLARLVTTFTERAAELGALGDEVDDHMRRLANRGVNVDELAVVTRLTKVDVQRVLTGTSFLDAAAGLRPSSRLALQDQATNPTESRRTNRPQASANAPTVSRQRSPGVAALSSTMRS